MRWQLIVTTMLVACLALASSGFAGDKGEKPPIFKTPEDAFAAAKKATGKGDWKAFVSFLAPETQEHVTAFVVMTGAVVEDVIPPFGPFPKELKGVKEQLSKVLTKYGLTADALKKMAADNVLTEIKGPPAPEALSKIAAAVKPADRVAFAGEALVVIAPVIAANSPDKSFDPFANKVLKEVKVDGEKATGKLFSVKDGVEQPNDSGPIMFRQINGSWYLVMPMGGAKKADLKPGEKK